MMSLASNLRVRRVRLDLSQKELAKRAGVSQQLIHALETGAIRSTKFVKEIAMALGCAATDLDAKHGVMGELGGSTNEFDRRHGDLPVFAAVETDRGSVAISDVAIDFITKPFPLMNVRGGYGILVAANFMYPEFEPGDYALVNPHIPPIPNTSCIFYREDADGTIGTIRRLTSVTPEEWHVKSWNPPPHEGETNSLPRDVWQKCHRIVGRYFRR